MVKVKDFTPSLINTTKIKSSIFLRIIAEQVVDVSRSKTPKDKGNLNQDVLKSVSGLHGTIEWRKKYAEYQERGARRDGSHRVRNYTTPGTGPHFAEDAVKKTIEKTTIIAKMANLI